MPTVAGFVVQQVKLPLMSSKAQNWIPHPVLKSLGWSPTFTYIQYSVNIHSERQLMMAQMFGSLTPTLRGMTRVLDSWL